ncbi:DMT family transporter [Paenibacillus hodogayensis]|uniref:DMT family transporter n=1 Tax=Paenibacillus hodogayensis TaxID=279208 RepID=A0ABV5W6Q9_9BACL
MQPLRHPDIRSPKHAAGRYGWFFVAATVILFQASDISLRVASVGTHYTAGAVLQAIPLLLLALTTAFVKRRTLPRSIPTSGWAAAAGYGCLQFLAGNVLFYVAVQLGGLSIASPAVQSQAIWAVLIGGVLLREPISRTMVGGIALFVTGLALMFGYKSAGMPLTIGTAWAFVFGLAGGLSWASASAVLRARLRSGMAPAQVLAVGAASGIVLLNVLIALVYDSAEVWATVTPEGALRLIAAGCFNGLAIWSFSYALRTIRMSKAIPVVSLSIVLNTIIGGVYFNEYVNTGSICGMLIAFLGVIIVQEPRVGGSRNRTENRVP